MALQVPSAGATLERNLVSPSVSLQHWRSPLIDRGQVAWGVHLGDQLSQGEVSRARAFQQEEPVEARRGELASPLSKGFILCC